MHHNHFFILKPAEAILFTLVVFLLGACKPFTPAGVMSEGKLEEVLYDYSLAISMADNSSSTGMDEREALRYQYIQKVFEKHDITEDYFDSTMVWYASEGKRLHAIYQRLNDRLDAEAKTLGVDLSDTEIYANYNNIDGDTTNVWNGSRIVYVSNYQPDNVKTITLASDSTYQMGDSFKLSYVANFLPSAGLHSAYILFSAYYEDNSVISQVHQVGGNYKNEINLIPTSRQDSLIITRLVVTLYAQPTSSQYEPSLFYMYYPSILRIHKAKPLPGTSLDKEDTDTAVLDTLNVDTLDVVRDTLERRLTPLEERDKREKRHDIEIVKERIQKPTGRRVTRRRML